MSRTTRVNGNDVKILDCQQGTHRETNARRVAARLRRDDDTVDRVIAGAGDAVHVWLDGTDGHDDNCLHFRPPDGWDIAYTDVVSSGGVSVTIHPSD